MLANTAFVVTCLSGSYMSEASQSKRSNEHDVEWCFETWVPIRLLTLLPFPSTTLVC
jgi:hypothetical protein